MEGLSQSQNLFHMISAYSINTAQVVSLLV